MNNFVLLTNDVETTSIWHNSLRDETGIKVYKEGMPALLDLYAKYNIKSTFFFTGHIARMIPDIVKMVQPYGHEIASHGLTHELQYSFDNLSFDEQIRHLTESKKILEDISGDEVITFRAPAARVQKNTALALAETGFKIDSSLSSQRFDFFLTFGNIKKLKWFTIPRIPYYTSVDNIFKRGSGSIFEIPISAFVIAYIGTTMRIFPNLISIIRLFLHYENYFNKKPVVFLTHPNEFIDESMEDNYVNNRSSNPIAHFLGDIIRRKLKLNNLGPKAIPIYERHIKYFLKKKYQYLTLKDYYLQIKDA
tara:strand:- start:1226 stop:2146 length:921 start_codon:yes stop_codon:yes gene_type:complete